MKTKIEHMIEYCEKRIEDQNRVLKERKDYNASMFYKGQKSAYEDILQVLKEE